jgi:hypothetical protein
MRQRNVVTIRQPSIESPLVTERTGFSIRDQLARFVWMRRQFRSAILAVLALIAPTQAIGANLALLPENPRYRENVACSTIAPPPIVEMPHSEGDFAVCFAYGAADMIAQRIGVAVSPVDLATGYFLADADHPLRYGRPGLRDSAAAFSIAESRKGVDVTIESNPRRTPYVNRLEGGEERFAVQIANARGLCHESDLPSNEGFRHHLGQLFYFRFLALAATQTKICRKGLFGVPPELRDDMADAVNIAWLNYVETRCQRFKSPVPLKPVTYHLMKDLATLLHRKAKGWRWSPAQALEAFARIDYALDHKRYPVVGYSYEVLEKRMPGERDGDVDHSSVIVARKMMGGACHYMVQDDSGESCVNFYPRLHDRCTLGRIWLTRPELHETLHSVTYLR